MKKRVVASVLAVLGCSIFYSFSFISYSGSPGKSLQVLTDSNPITKNKFTADPGAMIYGDKVYLYTGYDEAPARRNGYEMHDWLCYSSSDMVNWTEHEVPLRVKDFAWAKDDAWASQVIYRNKKFYWYVAVEHATIPGKAIGVAVSDSLRAMGNPALFLLLDFFGDHYQVGQVELHG